MASFFGGFGDDTITPTFVSLGVLRVLPLSRPDAGSDELFGGSGNDTLDAGGGSDRSFGGSGNDLIFAVSGIDRADGGSGIDTLNTTRFSGDYRVNLTTGLTNFDGESFTSFVNLISGVGNDSLTGSISANQIFGGDGNDTINGFGGADASFGGAGDDVIFAVVGDDDANGGSGADTLNITQVFGLNVNLATGLTQFGGESFLGFENVVAGSGANSVVGTSGANAIFGGADNDTINGAGGADASFGGSGNDLIFAGVGIDSADGGIGTDMLNTTAFGGSYLVNLVTGFTNVVGERLVGFENLISGGGNDSLTGTNGANLIDGGGGNDMIRSVLGDDTLDGRDGDDLLFSGANNDNLRGGSGADTLEGGAGTDRLSGGFGADVFVFANAETSSGAASDTIDASGGAAAFEGTGNASGDLIDLSQIDANRTLAGNQTFGFGGDGIGRLRLVNENGNTVILASNDADAEVEFRLVIVDGEVLAAAYTAADFIL